MDSHGQTRTNRYLPNGTKLYAEDEATVTARNQVRKLAEDMVGGRGAFARLPSDQKLEIKATARVLFGYGCNFASAERNEQSDKRGFVYVIEHPAFPGYVKVGRAFNPESRLNGYQTGCPHRAYKLYASVYFEDCHFAEKEIHARLDGEHRQGALGEWFKITPFLARHNINKLRSVL